MFRNSVSRVKGRQVKQRFWPVITDCVIFSTLLTWGDTLLVLTALTEYFTCIHRMFDIFIQSLFLYTLRSRDLRRPVCAAKVVDFIWEQVTPLVTVFLPVRPISFESGIVTTSAGLCRGVGVLACLPREPLWALMWSVTPVFTNSFMTKWLLEKKGQLCLSNNQLWLLQNHLG